MEDQFAQLHLEITALSQKIERVASFQRRILITAISMATALAAQLVHAFA